MLARLAQKGRKPLKVGGMIFALILYPALLLIFMLAWKEDAFLYALCMTIPIFFGVWVVVSLHLRTIWFVLFFLTLLYIHDWWSVGLVVIIFLLIQLVLSKTMTKEAVSIASPSPQRLYVYQGGNTFLVNHHWRYPPQRYALDLTGFDASGRRASGFFPKDLTAYLCFGTPLLSPLAGTVVHVENDQPDLAVGCMDKEHPLGNCIIIRPAAQQNMRIVLAHLMYHSITVQPGSVVQAGEIIGRIGNSGNTSEPHLHIHAQKMEHGKLKGVPLKVEGCHVMRNSVIRPSTIPSEAVRDSSCNA
ncbi:MAG: M23 family metallopeptidase [Ktedonobacteraceae bacterium]